jgi:hypothetical protein
MPIATYPKWNWNFTASGQIFTWWRFSVQARLVCKIHSDSLLNFDLVAAPTLQLIISSPIPDKNSSCTKLSSNTVCFLLKHNYLLRKTKVEVNIIGDPQKTSIKYFEKDIFTRTNNKPWDMLEHIAIFSCMKLNGCRRKKV